MMRLMIEEILQQKVARRHDRDFTELAVITNVVGHNDIAASSNSTLVLQQVLEVTDRAELHRICKLLSGHRCNFHDRTKSREYVMYLLFRLLTEQIGHGGKGHSSRIASICPTRQSDKIVSASWVNLRCSTASIKIFVSRNTRIILLSTLLE